jgi:hypothetical protein
MKQSERTVPPIAGRVVFNHARQFIMREAIYMFLRYPRLFTLLVLSTVGAGTAVPFNEADALNGYDGAAIINAVPFASCSDNTIVKWNGTNWSVINACQYNSGISTGGLTCYKIQY